MRRTIEESGGKKAVQGDSCGETMRRKMVKGLDAGKGDSFLLIYFYNLAL